MLKCGAEVMPLRLRNHGWVLALLVTLAGCGGEVAVTDDPNDLEHPELPPDGDLPEGADVPLLPPIDDDPDAAVLEGDAAGPESDLGAVIVDVPTAGDVPAVVDVGMPTCVGSASGPSSRWTCAPSRVRQRCISGLVQTEECPNGCVAQASGADDTCAVAPRMCVGSASGQSSLWTCTSTRSARQRCVSGVVQNESCANGCVPQPSGTNDYCASAPPPLPPSSPTTLPTCARRPLLHWGLHPTASDHLRCAGVPAARITQTIGYATASAGTHAPDGRVAGVQYAAATDISTRSLSSADIRTLLSRLANQGFAAWYRWPGHDGWPSSQSPHIHAIYVGAAMKSSLRSQVRSWLDDRNGLVSNTRYGFYSWTSAQQALIRVVFNRYN